jgi:hypothetical protein
MEILPEIRDVIVQKIFTFKPEHESSLLFVTDSDPFSFLQGIVWQYYQSGETKISSPVV